MKKILVSLLLLLSAHASAETWVMPNDHGGEITITDQTCKADNGRWTSLKHAYAWTNKAYIEGCWTMIDGNVHITWIFSNGNRERRVYSPSGFNKKSSY